MLRRRAMNLPASETEFSLILRKNPCAEPKHLIIFVQIASTIGTSRSSKRKSLMSDGGPSFFVLNAKRRYGLMAAAGRPGTNRKHQRLHGANQLEGDFFFLAAFFLAFDFSFSGVCGVFIAPLSAASKRAVASLALYCSPS